MMKFLSFECCTCDRTQLLFFLLACRRMQIKNANNIIQSLLVRTLKLTKLKTLRTNLLEVFYSLNEESKQLR